MPVISTKTDLEACPVTSDQTALAIYIVMARDAVDALDMIQECQDREALGLLQAMLTATGNPDTDQGLNALFVRPVRQRLDQLGGPVDLPCAN